MIEYERQDATAIIRLNRPDKRNALSAEMVRDLTNVFSRLSSDNDLRAVILTGTGAAFSAGTDIGELDGLTETEAAEISLHGQELCNAIDSFPVPVIAAVNGVAAGGGCELVLACHLRIAATDTTLSLPETMLGLIPAYGGTQRLPVDVGVARALELMLSGKEVDAVSALNLGIVNRVVEPPELLSTALSMANEIAALAPLAIRACLKAVNQGLRLPIEEGLALERELFASLFATEDAREGTKAFLEKRPPVFKGK